MKFKGQVLDMQYYEINHHLNTKCLFVLVAYNYDNVNSLTEFP